MASHVALGPLREDVTGAAPEVVLTPAEFDDQEHAADSPVGEAIVEVAVLRAAVRAKKEENEPMSDVAPPPPGASAREGDLRALTEWLLLVARAYARDDIAATTTGATGVRA
ncbi:DUF6545 domain-containing protein [Streptomyces sp. NPDC004286]|uniref:DUF6545 domain-containing protein n=1 Tax=Streptomyces sp. NPDC004286 TaxID=3364696 RepID=UPI00368797AE